MDFFDVFLSWFRWYRRWRGGAWYQCLVDGPLGDAVQWYRGSPDPRTIRVLQSEEIEA